MALDWVESQLKPKFMQRTADGQLVSVTMYYDPVIEHNNPGGTGIGLGLAFYLLPYQPEVAREMFDAWVKENDLSNPSVKVTPAMVSAGQLSRLGLILAQEFGEAEIASKLRTVLDTMMEPKMFGDGEFGFFSHLGEEWPRGQSSALYICSEVMSPGAWYRAFNSSDWAERFSQPTVSGVDFPNLGIAVARNDLSTGDLIVETYAAAASAAGANTSFRLTSLEQCDLSALTQSSTCDGITFDGFSIGGDGTVTVDTTVGDHSFVFRLNFHGSAGGVAGARL